MGKNTQKNTRRILAVMILILMGVYVASILGQSGVISALMAITGFLIALLIFVQVGIIAYFKDSKFKKITLGDFIVIFGAILATVIAFNSIIILLPVLGTVLPEGLISFTEGVAIVSGIVGAIMGVMLLLTKDPQ